MAAANRPRLPQLEELNANAALAIQRKARRCHRGQSRKQPRQALLGSYGNC